MSEAATVHIQEALKITKQPKDYTGELGSQMSFSVEANGKDVSYQWQFSKDGGKTWGNITGATKASYSGTLQTYHEGRQFRCVVSAGKNEVVSEAANAHIQKAEDTEVTVTLNANGGYFNESGEKITTKQEKVDKNESYTLPYTDPVHDGNYVFAGWYNNPECTGDKVVSYRNFL